MSEKRTKKTNADRFKSGTASIKVNFDSGFAEDKNLMDYFASVPNGQLGIYAKSLMNIGLKTLSREFKRSKNPENTIPNAALSSVMLEQMAQQEVESKPTVETAPQVETQSTASSVERNVQTEIAKPVEPEIAQAEVQTAPVQTPPSTPKAPEVEPKSVPEVPASVKGKDDIGFGFLSQASKSNNIGI